MTIRPAATAAAIAVVFFVTQSLNAQDAATRTEIEARVRLAWLADRELCRYYPCARIDDGKLYVGGYVASPEQRRRAVEIAAAVGGLPVVDQLAVHPGLAITIPRVPSDQLLREATIAVRNAFPSQSSQWTVVATNDDRLLVQGKVESIATKLEVSERLRRVRGCHGVVNQLWVGKSAAHAASQREPAKSEPAPTSLSMPSLPPSPPAAEAKPAAERVGPLPSAGEVQPVKATTLPPPPAVSSPVTPAPTADKPPRTSRVEVEEQPRAKLPQRKKTVGPTRKVSRPKFMDRVSTAPRSPSNAEPPLFAPPTAPPRVTGSHRLKAAPTETPLKTRDLKKAAARKEATAATLVVSQPTAEQPERTPPRTIEQRVWTAQPTPALQPILERTVPVGMHRGNTGAVVPAWRPIRGPQARDRTEPRGTAHPGLHPWSAPSVESDQKSTKSVPTAVRQASFRPQADGERRRPLVYTRRRLATRTRSLVFMLPGASKTKSERASGFPTPAERNIVQQALRKLCGGALEQFYLMEGDVLIVRARAGDAVGADRLARGVFSLPELRIYEVRLYVMLGQDR